MYALNLPHHVRVGANSRFETEAIIEECGAKKVLLLSDRGVMSTGRVEELAERLKKKADVLLIGDVPSEPERGQVREIYERARNFGASLVIAVGGGSVMDTTKLVSAMMTNPEFSEEVIDATKIVNTPVPTVLIPTTAGTGSEATQNAIVLVQEKSLKVGVVSSKFIPTYVLLDPVLTLTVPAKITAATGVDALCHAIETLISKKTNPVCQTFSLRAIRLIFDNLEQCFRHPDDMQARENMLLAAFYGGICINTSSTVAVHALAYPLGGSYHIAHGVSNAMLLAQVMEYNEDACIDGYCQIADTLGVDASLSQKERADEVVKRVCALVRTLEIPTDLSAYHVSRDDIDFLTDSAFEVKRLLDQNPKPMTKADIRKIYETLFPA